jgi:Family of unknown function (DUF6152)
MIDRSVAMNPNPSRQKPRLALILCAALTAAFALPLQGVPARAHHGWGSFDTSQPLDVSAAVIRSTWANPHGVVVLAVDGKEVTVELAPVSRMTARGLTPEAIAAGRTVRVFAYRNSSDPLLYRAEWIEADGKRVQLRR